jgi:hypothetical protein
MACAGAASKRLRRGKFGEKDADFEPSNWKTGWWLAIFVVRAAMLKSI